VDILFLQLILWFGMLFLIWTMKDSLGKVESAIENAGGPSSADGPVEACFQFARPERVEDVIGVYRDAQIFRLVRIEGKDYQFEHIDVGAPGHLEWDQRCIAPGLIYRRVQAA
jgi:hypothetical protein